MSGNRRTNRHTGHVPKGLPPDNDPLQQRFGIDVDRPGGVEPAIEQGGRVGSTQHHVPAPAVGSPGDVKMDDQLTRYTGEEEIASLSQEGFALLDMGAVDEATAKLSAALTKAVQINSPQAVVLSAVVNPQTGRLVDLSDVMQPCLSDRFAAETSTDTTSRTATVGAAGAAAVSMRMLLYLSVNSAEVPPVPVSALVRAHPSGTCTV